MAEATRQELEDVTQVIEELPNGKIRVYNITAAHWGDMDDPLTTIVIRGYRDVDPSVGKS